MFNNVEKIVILQLNFRNTKLIQYSLNNKRLLTFIK